MDLKRHSKRLSWLLRHGARETGLAMDPAGWVEVRDVLDVLGISRETLETVVGENDKRRLQLEQDRIRAAQGHSLGGTPVTAGALEATWEAVVTTETVFHGTSLDAVESIAREGLRPMDRTHVHLADARDAKVGKRAGVSLLLLVDPDRLRAAGIGLFRSPNGVLLARRVPRACIVGVEPRSRRAQAAADRLALLFGC